MTVHPVRVEVASPPQFARVRVLLRIALAIVLGWLGLTAGWVAFALYCTLPLVTSLTIASVRAGEFPTAIAPRIERVLVWLAKFTGFMLLLVDRFPLPGDDAVRVEIRHSGTPTVGSALLRLVTSIPSAFVLAVLWLPAAVLWIIAAAFVIARAPVPGAILAFQRGVLRWTARLAAYHASLVAEYPPFSFDTGEGPAVSELDRRPA